MFVIRARTLFEQVFLILIHKLQSLAVISPGGGTARTPNMGQPSSMRVLPRAIRERSVVVTQVRTLAVAVAVLFAKVGPPSMATPIAYAHVALRNAAAVGVLPLHSTMMAAPHSYGLLVLVEILAARALPITRVEMIVAPPRTRMVTVRAHQPRTGAPAAVAGAIPTTGHSTG
jgi:hypothetical protein